MDFETMYEEVKGLDATDVDNIIIGLPGDQEAVVNLVPFPAIGNSRHLDLLVGMLHVIYKALSKNGSRMGSREERKCRNSIFKKTLSNATLLSSFCQTVKDRAP